ncbi:hypothetical protein Q7P35_006884 [Cladosporium inversicolor]
MSGAEAAGLAMGVITIASLFTTCIELLDYFELGKNYLYDYELACTKVNLLHKRLSNWGCATRIQEPLSDEHSSFDGLTKHDAVKNSLLKLSAILSNTEGLRKKYDLRPVSQTISGLKKQSRSERWADWSLLLRRRTTWSIRDRAKFDRFIDDISFLIDNLEKVNGSESSSRMAPQLKHTQESGASAAQAQITINRARVSQPQQGQTTEPRLNAPNAAQPGINPTLNDSSGTTSSHDDSGRTFSATAEHIHTNGVPSVDIRDLKQVNDNIPFAHLAIVDPVNGVWTLSNSTQHNLGRTTAFMGGGSVDALLRLQQAAYDNERSLGK